MINSYIWIISYLIELLPNFSLFWKNVFYQIWTLQASYIKLRCWWFKRKLTHFTLKFKSFSWLETIHLWYPQRRRVEYWHLSPSCRFYLFQIIDLLFIFADGICVWGGVTKLLIFYGRHKCMTHKCMTHYFYCIASS